MAVKRSGSKTRVTKKRATSKRGGSVVGAALVGGMRKKKSETATLKKAIMDANKVLKKKSGSKTMKKGGAKSKTAMKKKPMKKKGGAVSKSGRPLTAYNMFVKKFFAELKKDKKKYESYTPRERMAMAAAAYRNSK